MIVRVISYGFLIFTRNARWSRRGTVSVFCCNAPTFVRLHYLFCVFPDLNHCFRWGWPYLEQPGPVREIRTVGSAELRMGSSPTALVVFQSGHLQFDFKPELNKRECVYSLNSLLQFVRHWISKAQRFPNWVLIVRWAKSRFKNVVYLLVDWRLRNSKLELLHMVFFSLNKLAFDLSQNNSTLAILIWYLVFSLKLSPKNQSDHGCILLCP